MTHILDTSAWLAHLLHESGMERVSLLLLDPACKVGITTPSILELHNRLKILGRTAQWEEILQGYQAILEPFHAITESVAHRAILLRQSTTTRLPAIDSLIAATASIHNAILVHRDPHFLTIPDNLLKQELLPEK